MPFCATNGIELCFERFGSASDAAVVLISGLGNQMLSQHPDYCARFVDDGFSVIRFDNRDAGLSTVLDAEFDVGQAISALREGRPVDAPYRLSDMAADTVGLLDHLGIDAAHLVGVSMGGMIAQTTAIEHPDRVRSLVSVMSTTGDPDVGAPTVAAREMLFAPTPSSRHEAIELAVETTRVIGSPAYFDAERVRAEETEKYDRRFAPDGTARQLLAIWASGSRSPGLAACTTPTLVVHGRNDPLVALSGGERTADVVPDAELVVLDELGHDRPPELWSQLVDPICEFMHRVDERARAS